MFHFVTDRYKFVGKFCIFVDFLAFLLCEFINRKLLRLGFESGFSQISPIFEILIVILHTHTKKNKKNRKELLYVLILYLNLSPEEITV